MVYDPSVTLEKTIEAYLTRQVVSHLNGLTYKLQGLRGVSDRLLILPQGGHVFVEVKNINGKQSELQIKRQAKLKELGHWATVVYSKEDVDSLIKIIKTELGL